MMKLGCAAAVLFLAGPLAAQDMSAFKTGPVLLEFGPHAAVPGRAAIPQNARFAIAFDVSAPAPEGALNRGFETAARFLNMHAAAGVAPENTRLAVVVHGRAGLELMRNEAHAVHSASRKGDNPSAGLVAALLGKGVRFILCGQTAAAYGIAPGDLIEGVEVSLSAMTSHALLQQQGYTANPF